MSAAEATREAEELETGGAVLGIVVTTTKSGSKV